MRVRTTRSRGRRRSSSRAQGADPEPGDTLTFCWEQMDETETPFDITFGPLVRSRLPGPSPVRYYPLLQNVLANVMDPWDKLATVDRIMTMRLTVRGASVGFGGHDWDEMVITVAGDPHRGHLSQRWRNHRLRRCRSTSPGAWEGAPRSRRTSTSYCRATAASPGRRSRSRLRTTAPVGRAERAHGLDLPDQDRIGREHLLRRLERELQDQAAVGRGRSRNRHAGASRCGRRSPIPPPARRRCDSTCRWQGS